MSSLLPGQSPVGLMGRQLLLDRLEQGFIDNRRLLPRQKLNPVFDLADEEPVAEQVERAPRPKGMPPRVLPVLEVFAFVQMLLALRSRTNSLMPETSRYLRKIMVTRSASSSTTISLPSLNS